VDEFELKAVMTELYSLDASSSEHSGWSVLAMSEEEKVRFAADPQCVVWLEPQTISRKRREQQGGRERRNSRQESPHPSSLHNDGVHLAIGQATPGMFKCKAFEAGRTWKCLEVLASLRSRYAL
jgi:hypothetical protein